MIISFIKTTDGTQDRERGRWEGGGGVPPETNVGEGHDVCSDPPPSLRSKYNPPRVAVPLTFIAIDCVIDWYGVYKVQALEGGEVDVCVHEVYLVYEVYFCFEVSFMCVCVCMRMCSSRQSMRREQSLQRRAAENGGGGVG